MAAETVAAEPAALRDLDGSPSLLQSGYWGALKQRFGWTPHPFRLRGPDGELPLLVLSRRLGAGLTLAYVPYGPAAPLAPAAIGRALRPWLPADCVFLRFDLPWPRREADPLLAAPLRRAPMDIQPASTVVVDLGPDEEALLAAMKHKTRYNIRLAFRKGVTVEEGGTAELEDWYRLYVETARRDRIALHDPSYYREIFRLAAEYGPSAPRLRLYLARHEGELLAGIIVAYHGTAGRNRGATYLYGASSDRKRSLMPSYALQWEAMRQARADGCSSYDLFGIPPQPDPDHPMAGLYRFKTGFGGAIVHRPGCWDLPYRGAAYAAYRAAERARRFYFHRLRKAFPRRGVEAPASD